MLNFLMGVRDREREREREFNLEDVRYVYTVLLKWRVLFHSELAYLDG